MAWGATVDTPLPQGYPRFELPGKQTGAGFSPTSMNVLVVCLSRSGEMKAQQLDVRFAPFQTFIHVASRRQPPAPHRWAHTAGA